MLVIVPDYVSDKIDAIVKDFRAAHPDATDDDAAHIRQQLVGAFAEYGTIPEFSITKTEAQ
jgi:hypothetical protein